MRTIKKHIEKTGHLYRGGRGPGLCPRIQATGKWRAESSSINRRLLKFFFGVLLDSFGSQGWWPTTPFGSNIPQYFPGRSIKGLGEKEKLEICLGAILTQNTSWNNVVRVLNVLSEKNLLDVHRLLKVRRPTLEKLLRSSGYFRQKALRVRGFLKVVLTEAGGRFSKFLTGPLLDLRTKLLASKGIGPETADSMILYAAGKPIFVVDAYTRRITSRWGIIKGDEPYDQIQRVFMDSLPRSADLFGEYHALLVELGKKFCKKVPVCRQCPVFKFCKTGKGPCQRTVPSKYVIGLSRP